MPYAAIEDLPESVRAHLPRHAQEIYRAAFNSAFEGYRDQSPEAHEERAHKVAWAAVKHSYRKDGERWVPR